jgi:hypothetical protein
MSNMSRCQRPEKILWAYLADGNPMHSKRMVTRCQQKGILGIKEFVPIQQRSQTSLEIKQKTPLFGMGVV